MKHTATKGRGDSAAQNLRNRLRYHATGAIERGEAEAITEQPAEHVREWRYFNANRAEHWITSPDFHDVIGEANTREAAQLMAKAPAMREALENISEIMRGKDAPQVKADMVRAIARRAIAGNVILEVLAVLMIFAMGALLLAL